MVAAFFLSPSGIKRFMTEKSSSLPVLLWWLCIQMFLYLEIFSRCQDALPPGARGYLITNNLNIHHPKLWKMSDYVICDCIRAEPSMQLHDIST